MALDGDGLLALCATRFNHVRINGALREPFGARLRRTRRGQLRGFGLEDLHELAPDDLAFGFGIADTCQMAQKLLGSIDPNDFGMQFPDEHLHDHVTFIEAKQAVVHKHTGQLVTDRTMDECSSDGGVNPSAQTEDHLFITHLLTDPLHRLGNVVAHDPIWLGATDLQNESLKQLLPFFGVGHLGMELNRVKATRFVSHTRDRAGCVRGHHREAGGQFRHFIPVAHPDIQDAVPLFCTKILQAIQQSGVAVSTHLCRSKLPRAPCFHFAAELLRHGLHAVTNAQYGNAKAKDSFGGFVRLVFIDTGVATRQDDALQIAICSVGSHPLVRNITGMNFTEHVGIAYSASNKLGDLRSEVKNQNLLMHGRLTFNRLGNSVLLW